MTYDDTGNKRVGVLIPTYNRKSFLRLALDSVINQTYQDIEIIVIDNGSRDGTAEYMTAIADPRFKYIVNEQNLGLIGSINRGIGLFSVEVEWCTILCDDDLFGKEFIAEMVSSLDKQAVKSIVHSRKLLINETGKTIKELACPPDVESALDYIVNRSRGKRQTYLTGVFFSRQAFYSIGGYPEFNTGMATDDAFIFALSIKDRLVFNKGAIASIRIHEGAESLNVSGSIKHMRALKEFRTYVENTAKNSGMYNPAEITHIIKVLCEYVRLLNSTLWLRDAQSTAMTKNALSGIQLPELCKLTEDKSYQFTTRVQLDSYCMEKLKYCPEKNRAYRLCWSAIEQMKRVAIKCSWLTVK